jgi:hypothetical protein
LFIMAGVFLATDDVRRQFDRIGELERKVDDLYALFAAEMAATDSPDTSAQRTPNAEAQLVALPAGSSYHRPGCTLVAGKTDAQPIDAGMVHRRRLRPCRVCEPPAAD